MGVSSLDFLGNFEGGCSPNGPLALMGLDLGAQSRRRREGRKQYIRWRRSRRFSGRLGGPRRRKTVVEKKVRALRKLVPKSESMGLDGLFRDTAEYILALQMRVQVMQIMVQVLSGSESSDE
ncbi:hypothetical protein Acr_17g0000870 [Actinidia rufa]|uniref:Sequence-specific DNA binding transcription factor n=1 Tax=Actinidia rufa TaxID=165716 RepID=A0A7J0G0Q9_9ERIC|nr:hypothetical protein Acr_17g0000870 [Actinidia rufa]